MIACAAMFFAVELQSFRRSFRSLAKFAAVRLGPSCGAVPPRVPNVGARRSQEGVPAISLNSEIEKYIGGTVYCGNGVWRQTRKGPDCGTGASSPFLRSFRI